MLKSSTEVESGHHTISLNVGCLFDFDELLSGAWSGFPHHHSNLFEVQGGAEPTDEFERVINNERRNLEKNGLVY